MLDWFKKRPPVADHISTAVLQAGYRSLPVSSQGVDLGVWRLKDHAFRLVAAPEENRVASPYDRKTYTDIVSEVADLNSWHGHNGLFLGNSDKIPTRLLNAITPQWFLPPAEVVAPSPETDHRGEGPVLVPTEYSRTFHELAAGSLKGHFGAAAYITSTLDRQGTAVRYGLPVALAPGETLGVRVIRAERLPRP